MSKMFRHVGVVVASLQESLNIYQNFLGLELKAFVERNAGPHVDNMVGVKDTALKVAIMRCEDNNRIELIEYLNHPGVKRSPVLSNDIGASHFALTVEDIDLLYVKSKDFPVKWVSPPATMPDGGVRMAYAILNDECIVELVQVLDKKATYSGGA
jgi:catechol 2,3-dioxygenase-like lactoylglutathione lyase family enzyme